MRFLNNLVEFTNYLYSVAKEKVKKLTTPTKEQPDSLPSAISEVQKPEDANKPGKEYFVIEHERKDDDGLEYWKYDPLDKL